MADEENGNGAPSLELPSLGFGRKRRKKATDTPAADQTDTAPPEATPADEPTPVSEPVPAPEPTPAAVPEPEPAPVPEPEPAPVPDPVPEPEPVRVAVPEPLPPEPAPDRSAAGTEVVDAMVPPEPGAPPVFVDEVSPPARTRATPRPSAAPAPSPAADRAPAPVVERGEDPDQAGTSPTDQPQRRARRSLPVIGGMAAAVLTGLVIGLATVGLTFASLHLCEAAKGTSSCGGPGFLLLVAILIAMVVLGGVLLRTLRVPDPVSTSFLAVGLMAVLILLFLVDVIFSWWMVIVIPVFAVATFALAHWVTTAFSEPADQ